jgi:DNA-binding CsgD family transcriptional regulator
VKRQACDIERGLKRARDTCDTLERALDWLADGVALVRADCTVIYASETFRAIVRRNDGVQLRKGAIEFADAKARGKFSSAVASAQRLRAGGPADALAADFVATRTVGGEPYLVSVRPLLDRRGQWEPSQAVAVVLARDPLAREPAAIGPLRELFGFTEAEAALAQALQSGVTLPDYAGRRTLSLNTVYTHLRRLREKTGCSRMAELIYKLNELRLPLRLE